jgi:hypothetical protein
MIPRHCYRIIAVLCALALYFAGVSSASAQNAVDRSRPIKITLVLDTDTLSRQKSAFATVTLENISGSEIDLKSICSFELLSTNREAVARNYSVFGDSYWSPVDLLTAQPLKLNIIDRNALKKGVVVGRVPEGVLHFTKDEIKTFKLDLTKLLWNASMGNDWPRWSLFESVPKGAYSLLFEVASSVDMKSNVVKVAVE